MLELCSNAPAFCEQSIPYMTQDNTPPGPIFRARLPRTTRVPEYIFPEYPNIPIPNDTWRSRASTLVLPHHGRV